jgi:hypothetical protein
LPAPFQSRRHNGCHPRDIAQQRATIEIIPRCATYWRVASPHVFLFFDAITIYSAASLTSGVFLTFMFPELDHAAIIIFWL